MVGNLVAGKRIAQASGRDLGQIEDNDLVKKVNKSVFMTAGERGGGSSPGCRAAGGGTEGEAGVEFLPVSSSTSS